MEYKILKNINSPDDIKALNDDALNTLCEEIREFLIETTSKTGGHLASNLGVVELTVAIHKAFNSPNDKIVFDVGHQSYTHKIITGRKDKFDTLRKENGISGFPRPDESEHDAFIGGHSSTSISAAFGLSQAKKIKEEDGFVVAVIGDGALTGGMVYEALNNAGRTDDNLIVILNENEMSISENVGSMSGYLTKIRLRPKYHKFKSRFEGFLLKIPKVGKKLRNWAFRTKMGVKGLFYNSTIFENMGFAYLGPINGHDLKQLDEVFALAKELNDPVLIHVKTVKGKGYSFAEDRPDIFHGISSFDTVTGETKSSGDTFSKIFGETLLSLADKDNRICAITAAMGDSTGLLPFKNKYPKRYFDVGIAEEHAVTFGCGLSLSGLNPVFAVYSTFLQRGYDQIIHDAAIQNTHLVIGVDRAGIVGDDGETHQGIFDVAFLNTIPNTTIYSPATFDDLVFALNRAIGEENGIQVVRYPRGNQNELLVDYKAQDKPYEVIGTSNKAAIVTYGRLFGNAMKAREVLKEKGFDVKIIKLNRIKPIDNGVYFELLGCENIFFFEEGIKNGGVAQTLGATLSEKGFKGNYSITAIDNKFVPQATVENSLKKLNLDYNSMINIVLGSKK